jgi:L-asparagine transporter-like permease
MATNAARGFTKRQIEYFALGGTLGAGIYIGVGQGIHAGGPALVLAYAIAGLAMYFVARCLGDIALNDVGGGTFVSYTRRHLGTRAAFVLGWGYWCCGLLVGMAELTAVGLIVHAALPAVPQWVPPFLGLIVLALVNALRVGVFGEIEFGMAVIKVGVLSVFLALGCLALTSLPLVHVPGAALSNLWSHGGVFPTGLGGFISVLPIALFGFAGAELVCLAAAETVDSARTLPRAINGLLIRLALFYVGTTLMIVLLSPWDTVSVGGSPVADALKAMGLPAVGEVMTVVLVSVLLSSCNSLIFGLARVLKSLSEERCAPEVFGRLNEQGVPRAAVFIAAVSISATIVLNFFIPQAVFGLLMNSAAMTIVIVWAILMVVHLKYRKTKPAGSSAIFSAPWSPYSNYLVLAFLALMLAILAFDASFRPAFFCVAALFVALCLLALFRPRDGRSDTSRTAEGSLG